MRLNRYGPLYSARSAPHSDRSSNTDATDEDANHIDTNTLEAEGCVELTDADRTTTPTVIPDSRVRVDSHTTAEYPVESPAQVDEMTGAFDLIAVDDDRLKVSAPFVLGDKSAMSPDVAVDSDGTAWAVWAEGADQQVLVRRFDSSGAGAILTAGLRSGIEFQPCITNLAHGSLRVFWIAFRDGTWHLVTRSFRGEDFGSESIVASSADGLFHPRAAIDDSGNCWVVCEKVDGKETRIAVYRQSKDAWVEEPLKTLPGDCYRPELCLGPDELLWIAYDAHDGTNYRVAVQSVPASARQNRMTADSESEDDAPPIRGTKPFVVADDGYQNLQPSLARDNDGNLWIALASNRNEARRDPAWLTKWSYLYRFDGDSLAEPVGHRPDVDLYNEHAFQGWEFPAVGYEEDGGVLLVGQSAHSIVAQSYSGRSWSPMSTIVEARWGSWKPRCRVAGTGPLFVASMGLEGAQIQRVDVKRGAAEAHAAADAAADAAKAAGAAAVAVVPVGKRLAARVNPQTRIASREERPSIEAADGTTYNIFFGDLHAHSVYSDAVGDVDELYHRYRDIYRYDFAALTDHDFLDGIELSAAELKLIWNHAERFSKEDEFLAWFAYEWTSPAIAEHAAAGAGVGEGHRHILYPDQSGPLISYGDEDSRTGRRLLEKLNAVRALVIPHHTSWSGTDWDAHDDQLQRVVEVVSTHGRFEYPGNLPIGYRRDHIHPEKFVQAGLDRGYKLGFVGGSDSHGLRWHAIEMEGRASHIPEGTRVGWKEDAYRSGMTAILAEELTRESLFQAVYNRRCYATSGAPIVLDFRINGRLMGSEVALPLASKGNKPVTPKITVRVEGTAAVRSVEIIRSGHVFGGLQMQPGEGINTLSFELEDTMIVPGESHYYYARVLQEDGEMAWASPIWVR